MLTGKVIRTVLTAPKDDAPQQKTVLTIDFDGASDDACKAFIVSALTIKRQGKWRKKGIPATETVRVADYAPGMRHSEPVNVFEAAKGLTSEEKAKLIAQLQSA